MFTKKSVTTEVFALSWAELAEYCPALKDLSADAAEFYALGHHDEITRALVPWAADMSIWDEPEYYWTKTFVSTHWEPGEPGEVLVQFVLC